jgi:S1-C subfamily serine protease
MKQLFALVVAFYFTSLLILSASDYVTFDILSRVLDLRYGNEQGTGFTVEVDGRQYIVTAKHLVSGTNQVAEVAYLHNNNWEKLPVTILRSTDADVAVLVPPRVLTPTFPVEYSMTGVAMGQELFFLGFPYGMSTEVPAELNHGCPIPFIKRGTFSAAYKGKAKHNMIFVDGMNNSGFSGGPLVAVNSANKKMIVIGVVVGYRTNPDSVVTNNVDTGLKSLANSGIIICYDIEYAIDEIKKQQNGPEVPR